MNHAELEAFMESNGKDILSFCRYLTKNKEDAEDLCQDTLVTGYGMAKRVKDENHAKKFFLSIAVKLWKNRKRKIAWRHRIEDEQVYPAVRHETAIEEGEGTPERIAIQREERRIVRECVDALPEKKRLVVLLCYTEGLKEKEIAEVLGLPAGTVKSRLHQAKAELARMLSKRL